MSDLRIILDPDFIAQTKKEVTPHWGELGWVTYKLLINVLMLDGSMIKIALKIGTKLLNA